MAVVERLQPHRIGHGIRAAYDESAMRLLREQDVVLELCPTSNLHTHAVSGVDELEAHRPDVLDRGVKVTLNTDGPYLLETDMQSRGGHGGEARDHDPRAGGPGPGLGARVLLHSLKPC